MASHSQPAYSFAATNGADILAAAGQTLVGQFSLQAMGQLSYEALVLTGKKPPKGIKPYGAQVATAYAKTLKSLVELEMVLKTQQAAPAPPGAQSSAAASTPTPHTALALVPVASVPLRGAHPAQNAAVRGTAAYATPWWNKTRQAPNGMISQRLRWIFLWYLPAIFLMIGTATCTLASFHFATHPRLWWSAFQSACRHFMQMAGISFSSLSRAAYESFVNPEPVHVLVSTVTVHEVPADFEAMWPLAAVAIISLGWALSSPQAAHPLERQ